MTSGLLSWVGGSNFLRLSQDVVAGPYWQPPVAHPHPLIVEGLFLFLLLHGLVWIAGSLAVLRSLSRHPGLRGRIEEQWWAVPILPQIVTFGEHWVMATFYVLLTGQISRGGLLGLLSGLHIFVVLLIGPACTDEPSRAKG